MIMPNDKTSVQLNEEEDIFYKRESIPLTPENAVFTRSAGGLISLEIINANGEKEFF